MLGTVCPSMTERKIMVTIIGTKKYTSDSGKNQSADQSAEGAPGFNSTRQRTGL